MAHTLIIGQVESGKTTLAKMLARRLRRKGHGVLVLDHWRSSDWDANEIATNAEDFRELVYQSRRCYCFIDEAPEMLQKDRENDHFATMSRHWGHSFYFISQRVMGLNPMIRTNCQNIFCFKQHHDASRILAREFVCDKLFEAKDLLSGEFIGKMGVDDPGKKFKINFQKQVVISCEGTINNIVE